MIGVLPYQLGHSWDWIFNVYKDLGTRFSEASVGAFNFMGLIGGMGTPDTDKIFGAVSYSAFGLALTCAVYLIASYLDLARDFGSRRAAGDFRRAVRLLHVRAADA